MTQNVGIAKWLIAMMFVLGVQGAWANTVEQSSLKKPNASTLQLNEQDLLADMPLFEAILLQAIDENRSDDVRSLFALYQRADEGDVVIASYVKAYLAMTERDYKTAIATYHRILEQYPDFYHLRWQLAQAYANDKQYQNAHTQLAIVQQDDRLDVNQQAHLAQDALWLLNQSRWQTQMDFGGLYDKNINKAPKVRQYQHWQFEPAIRAYGAWASLSAQKTQNFYDNWSWQSALNLQGQWYNKHRFDDIHATVYGGVVYQDARQTASFMPFYQKRWYGTKAYADGVGVKMDYQRVWQDYHVNLSLVGSQQQHNSRPFLDGARLMATVSLQKDGKWLGLHHQKQHAKDKSEAFVHNSLAFGVHKKWSADVGSWHKFDIAHRKHEADDIFNITRQDWRYITEHRFWHNRLAYLGFVPSLNINYEKIDSNHFAFDTTNTHVYVALRRAF